MPCLFFTIKDGTYTNTLDLKMATSFLGEIRSSKLSEGEGECEVQYLTPGKYSYQLTYGKKQLSKKQKEELSNISICMDQKMM